MQSKIMKNNQENDTIMATPSMLDVQKLATSRQVFATAGEVANMVGYAVDTIISRLTESPTLGGRVYALATDFATRWGRDPRTVKDWLNKAEKDGLIHPMQGVTSSGKDGDVLYHIAEVEAVFKDRRRANIARK